MFPSRIQWWFILAYSLLGRSRGVKVSLHLPSCVELNDLGRCGDGVLSRIDCPVMQNSSLRSPSGCMREIILPIYQKWL